MDEAFFRYVAARNFHQSAVIIFGSPQNTPERKNVTLLPMLHLCGFAMELYFKAILLRTGIQSNVVRSFGHDLERLYAESSVHLVDAHPYVSQVVSLLHGPHRNFTYRYLQEDGEYAVPNWVLFLQTIEEYDALVDGFVGATKYINSVKAPFD